MPKIGSLSWSRIALSATVLAVVVGLAIRNFWPIPMNLKAEAWAAWVQAIGSVLAICVAIWIPWHQRREDEITRTNQLALEAKLVAGAISPLFAIYLRRLNFFANKLANSDRQEYLSSALPESTFDLFPGLERFQRQLHLLGDTGVLANEVIGDLYILQMAMRILHREKLTSAAYQRMQENCPDVGLRLQKLIAELDAICPPRRDAILEEAARGNEGRTY